MKRDSVCLEKYWSSTAKEKRNVCGSIFLKAIYYFQNKDHLFLTENGA